MSNIICHCKMVTEKEIKALIKKDAASAIEIMEFTGAGSGCGRCKPRVVDFVKRELEKRPVEKQLRLF
ncbi:MAG: (2Fe-2S)-binding protein [Breznakibacter sp.]